METTEQITTPKKKSTKKKKSSRKPFTRSKNRKWRQIHKMVADYDNGMKLKDVAEKYGVGFGALRHQFAKAGGVTRNRKGREAVKHAEKRALKSYIVEQVLEHGATPRELIIYHRLDVGKTFIHDTIVEKKTGVRPVRP